MNVVKNIICELTGYRPGTVDVSQGDRGSRAVSCRLLENGAAWMIPEGATARVAYTLPDGTEGLYDRRPDGSPMWEIAQNTVTVELADQLMAQAGMVQMSILIIGPEGGQLATWPIRVMVSANKAARLTVPEEMPPYGAGFAGKIFFGGEDGTVTPLGIGEGVKVVRQEDGTFALVACGGSGGGGGITDEKDPTVYEWAKQPQKPAYTAQEVGALPADTKIPGTTSELTNDAGFVTKAVSDLENYFTRKQTLELIAAIPRFRITVVQQLPTAGEELTLYLVPFATGEGQYLEYIWAEGRWEIIGNQRVDLTGYATEVWVKDYVAEHSGQNLSLDTTLTQSGKAADAKAVGDALNKLEEKIPSIEGLAKEEDIPIKPEDIGAQPAGSYASPDDIPKVPNWAMQASKPTYTASEVGADPKGTAAAAVSTHNTSTDAHNDLRRAVQQLQAAVNAFLDVDDTTRDELSEVLALIDANADVLETITTSKVSVSDIINNLTTNVDNKPLSAAQGVAIKALIDGLSASLANYQPKGNYALASAVPTKVSQLQNDAKYLTAVTAAMITAALGYTPINPGLATLARNTDGLLYLFVNGKPVGSGVDLPTGGIDGYITADKQIIFNNLPDGEYTLAYINDDGDIVPIGAMEKDTNVYYSVTTNLTNCTISNSATQVIEGESYSATITAKTGHELKSVSVTMGGSAVTVSGGSINIASVTGNIVITAVAEEVQTGPTNLANPNDAYWKEGYRLSISSGGTSALSGHTVTNFIPAKAGDVLRVKGMKLTSTGGGTSSDCKIVLYSAKDNESSKVAGAFGSGTGDTYTSMVTVNGDVSSLTVLTLENGTQLATSAVKYLRIDGTLLSGYSKNDVIITINEPIE